MLACIDAGHGWGNRRPGVYDPGAVHHEAPGESYEEADIALDYSRGIASKLFETPGVNIFMTREDGREDRDRKAIPVWGRAKKARLLRCDVLVSVHVNYVDSDKARGCETWHDGENSRKLAHYLQSGMVRSTGFRDRGVKVTDELSVLQGPMPSALLELGFLANDAERNVLLNPDRRAAICAAIAAELLRWWAEGGHR